MGSQCTSWVVSVQHESSMNRAGTFIVLNTPTGNIVCNCL